MLVPLLALRKPSSAANPLTQPASLESTACECLSAIQALLGQAIPAQLPGRAASPTLQLSILVDPDASASHRKRRLSEDRNLILQRRLEEPPDQGAPGEAGAQAGGGRSSPIVHPNFFSKNHFGISLGGP